MLVLVGAQTPQDLQETGSSGQYSPTPSQEDDSAPVRCPCGYKQVCNCVVRAVLINVILVAHRTRT